MKLKSLLTLLIASVTASAVNAQETTPKYVLNQVVVKFKPSATAASKVAIHQGFGAVVVREFPQIGYQLVRFPSTKTVGTAMSYYKSKFDVAIAEPNHYKKYSLTTNDPLRTRQYSLARMRVNQAWDLNSGRPEVKIAVIDSGLDMDHPDFVGKVVDPFDYIDGDANPYPDDGEAHGTHVGGISAAATNNGVGIAGVGYNCKLMPLRFDLTDAGSAAMIMRAGDRGAKVANMSYGGPSLSTLERDAVTYSWNKGVVLVAAAGNDGSSNIIDIGYPARFPEVIVVGASDQTDSRAPFSNFGPEVDVAAPGAAITSAVINDYADLSGTSMASPNVAGVVGLMWSRAPAGTTNTKIRQVLESTCDFIGAWNLKGRVNADKALKGLAVVVTVPAAPVFLSVHEGSALTSSSKVLLNDGVGFTLGTITVPNLGKVASSSFSLQLPIDRSLVHSLKFVVDAKFATGSTGQIFLYNWNTLRWDYLKAFPLTSVDTLNSATLRSSFATYATAGGEIRVLIRGLLPSTVAAPVGSNFSVDFLELQTSYIVEE